MLSALQFQVQPPSPGSKPQRADVACFIGHVARRRSALPQSVTDALRAAGWIDGPWARDPEQTRALWQMPVPVDSWDAFATLFAWSRRPLHGAEPGYCASYLGAAVRSFFANGGRRAWIVRTGDPWPYLEAGRAAERDARLAALLPSLAAGSTGFDAFDPLRWRGVEHLYALAEVSFVCLPDLADICMRQPAPPAVNVAPVVQADGFVECSPEEPADPLETPLLRIAPPRLDVDGFAAWGRAVAAARGFLARHRRDQLLVSSVPLAQIGARAGGVDAQADPLGFWQAAGVLEPVDGEAAQAAASAFVQLGWPWLRTRRSSDLPAHLEPAEGVLVGVLSRNARGRGTFRSAAGTRVDDLVTLDPMPSLGDGPDHPAARQAERVCLFGPEPDGLSLLSDVTSSPDEAWRAGGVSRLMAHLLRNARRIGEAELFEANGAALWTRVRRAMETLLEGIWRGGGLGGARLEDAFTVRCGRDTTTQNDLDQGRLRVEITVLPVAAVDRITVVFELAGAPAGADVAETV